MSLVSILKNTDDIAAEKTKIFHDTAKLDCKETIQYVMKRCLLQQYDLMRTSMNQNMIDKRHFNPELKGKELIDALYQHIFSHNFIAYNDELFEVYEALEKRVNLRNKYHDFLAKPKENLAAEIPEGFVRDFILVEGLVIEEIIDVFHFLLEYIILLEELNQIMLLDSIDDLTVNDLHRYYVDCHNGNIFYKSVVEMLDGEASHLASDIFDLFTDWVESKHFDNEYYYGYDIDNNDFIKYVKCNRDFVRNTNFKDWKQYDVKSFYNQAQLTKLFDITRTMTKQLFTVLMKMTYNFSEIPESNILNPCPEDVKSTIVTLGAIYNSKRNENKRRQLNDPRYKINNTGEIVGEAVK